MQSPLMTNSENGRKNEKVTINRNMNASVKALAEAVQIKPQFRVGAWETNTLLSKRGEGLSFAATRCKKFVLKVFDTIESTK